MVLAAATLAACVFAGFNVRAENNFIVPTDRVWWVEAPANGPNGLCARQVPPGSPGDNAGVRQGDILLSVDDHPTERVAQLEREFFGVGSFQTATYSILRAPQPFAGPLCTVPANTRPFDIKVILEPTDRTINLFYRLIGVVYLLIGL